MKPGLYEKVAARADGCCEACLGGFGAHFPLTPEADHFWSRAKSETFETVWLIHAVCHRDKHASKPTAEHWLKRFRDFQQRHGFDTEQVEARLRFVQQRNDFNKEIDEHESEGFI